MRLKLRGIEQRNKIDNIGDFDNKTPTHMNGAHVNSKFEQKCQNGIPEESDETFCNPRVSMVH